MTTRHQTTTRRPDGQKNQYNNPVARKPFCKVCKDAGLSEEVYTNHFVKDQPGPNGRVVCPTLLNQACRICNNPGHTSSYCPQYKPRRDDRYQQQQREEPRREERYIEREPRREERYIEREPRREERYQRNDVSFNSLRDDTQRREREIEERDREYYREQERKSKPWLQAAMKESKQQHAPYAHPHGPRVCLVLESSALSVANHREQAVVDARAAIDVRAVQLNHSSIWGDEEVKPFDCDALKFAQEFLESRFVTDDEIDFIDACNNYDGENCFPNSPR